MHIKTSDPDISSICNRIQKGLIDLQPDFQRGEVWKIPKKQKLIDSILRGWHIPPVHLISDPNSDKLEVLDGQQRLASIRDFMNGLFPINGTFEPLESKLAHLDGMYWDDLPDAYQHKIEFFTIRFLTITDYKIGEPGELFHRLNHPTNLTPAEQRNAFFGESRHQVKQLVEWMTDLGYDKDTIGFTNSRMAYDDVIAKVLLTFDQRTLSKKITSSTITDKYRSEQGFDKRHISHISEALQVLMESLTKADTNVRFNKASFHSWILFVSFLIQNDIDISNLSSFILEFESAKAKDEADLLTLAKFRTTSYSIEQVFKIYNDRTTSRVADVSSVILRDMVLLGLYYLHTDFNCYDNRIQDFCNSFSFATNKGNLSEELLLSLAKTMTWREV